MLHAPTILQLLLIMFYCTNGTQAAYIILLNDTYSLLNNFRDDVLVCQICKYIGVWEGNYSIGYNHVGQTSYRKNRVLTTLH